MKKSKLLLICILFCIDVAGQKDFQAVSENLLKDYKFKLEKNFFKSEKEFQMFLRNFNSELGQFKTSLDKPINSKNLESLTLQLGKLEYDFRKMDLYLFLQFATSTFNLKANAIEDSIYDAIAVQRAKYRIKLQKATPKVIAHLASLASMKPFNYCISNILKNGEHELSQSETELIKPFSYLKNNGFYDELLSTKYNSFLRNGYTDSPANLLQQSMNIDISSANFCKESIDFIKNKLTNPN